mgnify:CR=1 FL=1
MVCKIDQGFNWTVYNWLMMVMCTLLITIFTYAYFDSEGNRGRSAELRAALWALVSGNLTETPERESDVVPPSSRPDPPLVSPAAVQNYFELFRSTRERYEGWACQAAGLPVCILVYGESYELVTSHGRLRWVGCRVVENRVEGLDPSWVVIGCGSGRRVAFFIHDGSWLLLSANVDLGLAREAAVAQSRRLAQLANVWGN